MCEIKLYEAKPLFFLNFLLFTKHCKQRVKYTSFVPLTMFCPIVRVQVFPGVVLAQQS